MKPPSLLYEDSLVSNETITTLPRTYTHKRKDLRLYGFILVCVLALTAMAVIQNVFKTEHDTVPIKASIPWFQNKPLIMQINTSRVFDPLLYSGHDNRTDQNYKSVVRRQVQWSVTPQGIVTVDMYGRINAIKQGNCTLKLKSLANGNAYDQLAIQVVNKRKDVDIIQQRIIKFLGKPAKEVNNLQKIVNRYSKQQIQQLQSAPITVKQASSHPQKSYPNILTDGDIIWTIQHFVDRSGRKYIKRENSSMLNTNRDKYQYLIGDRYLPGVATDPIMIQTDNNNGIWVVSESGAVNYISMVGMSYKEKDEKMQQQTQKCVLRHGIASGAYWNGSHCIPQISDNDGLWTAIYGAGQLMKYSVFKQKSTNQSQIQKIRNSALTSLKAVLLMANVAGRQGVVKTKIRHLNNSYNGKGGVLYSSQYLLQGKYDSRDVYVGRPSDGIGLFGSDANLFKSGQTRPYTPKYTMTPIKKQDWTTTGPPATTQRSLSGYMVRTFSIPAIDPPIPVNDGLFFRRTNSTTQHVLSGAATLYQYTNHDHPALQLGNKPIPTPLISYLNIDGVQYNASDLVYKGDTSTDQVVGHLFIYKIAYDILDDKDQQQKQLKQLIRETMRQLSQTFINNGYTMPDATGYATKWTKLYKQFLCSDYTIEDAPLKALQLILTLKLTYYVTGQHKWKQQYQLMVNDPKFKYLQLVAQLWKRWVNDFSYTGDRQDNYYNVFYNRNVTQIQIGRHTLYEVHFSDQEQAFLAYYVAFQLQDNIQYKNKYKQGIDGYWHSISLSQNPFWYYIYQLTTPNFALNDNYNNSLLETASWQLSRHMIDTTKSQAYIIGSRPDVIIEGGISTNPSIIIGTRTITEDEKYVNLTQNYFIPNFDPKNIYQVKVLPADERSIHKFNGATFDNIDGNHNINNVEPSTTYSTPYWFAVYHNMLEFNY